MSVSKSTSPVNDRILHPLYVGLSRSDKGSFRRMKSDLRKKMPDLSKVELEEIVALEWQKKNNILFLPNNRSELAQVGERDSLHAARDNVYSRTSQPSKLSDRATTWGDLLDILLLPGPLLLLLFITALGLFLVDLQATAYAKESIQNGFLIALFCELSMVVLKFLVTPDKAMNRIRLIGLFLVFAYTIGSQAYFIFSDAEREISGLQEGNESLNRVKASLTTAQNAKANAAKYGDHKAVEREDKNIKRYEMSLETINSGTTERAKLVDYEAFGVLALRAFLMIVLLVSVGQFREIFNNCDLALPLMDQF